MGIALKHKERMTERELAELGLCVPALPDQLRECLADIRHNQMLFDLETEPELIEQRIYEQRALECRYRYLLRQARAAGLRAIL